MKKQTVMLGIVGILLFIGLSGCNEITNPISNDKIISGDVKVTGDTGQIEIVNYHFTKQQTLFLNYTEKQTGWTNEEKDFVPWDLDISDINTNLSKRKFICDNYCFKEMFDKRVSWLDNYKNFTTGIYYYKINNFRLDHYVARIIVNGTAKNIGNEFLNNPTVIVNFYNNKGAWLASKTIIEDNIPSGYTWDFSTIYNGEFRNDVNSISFDVKTTPYP